MTPRNCLAAILLLCLFTALAAAQQPQGTPGGKTPIVVPTSKLPDWRLTGGGVRIFDGISTYGWKGDVNAKVENGKLYFDGNVKDSPFWFFWGDGTTAFFGPDIFKEVDHTPGEYFGRVKIIGASTLDVQSGTLTPMPLLFDGKTLNGWKIIGKAKAEVKGETISLTEGPGSLEYDNQFGDFILRLEYRTPVRPDGKGVKSGVFFRCLPGSTMEGYECQILNKPSDEDYAKNIGVDTGGLFRLQVGRNVGAKDGEWNYLLIAARGKRFATWVNGIQTTDFVDNRAPGRNAREGIRFNDGTIQLQAPGADADVQFRNIRIRALN